MKKLLSSSLLIALTFGFAACSTGPKIQYDAVDGYDFTAPKTYALIDTKGKGKGNIEVGPGISQAAEEGLVAALESKGLTPASAADADILVATYLQMTNKVNVTDYGYSYGGYRGYGYGYGGMGMGGGVTTTEYKDTTLTVDLVDNVDDTLVWRGWASKDIYSDIKGTTTDADKERIREIMANILANFPPPPPPEK